MKELKLFEILTPIEAKLGHLTQPVSKANVIRQLLEIEQKNLLDNIRPDIEESLEDAKSILNIERLKMQIAIAILILKRFEGIGNWDFEIVITGNEGSKLML